MWETCALFLVASLCSLSVCSHKLMCCDHSSRLQPKSLIKVVETSRHTDISVHVQRELSVRMRGAEAALLATERHSAGAPACRVRRECAGALALRPHSHASTHYACQVGS
jgi:hypothetical protein